MGVTQHKRFVRRQVEAYEESWKEDHDAVQELWGLGGCHRHRHCHRALLQRSEKGWRERVFRGIEPFSEDTNQFYLTLYRVWLQVTDSVLAVITGLEGDYPGVQGAPEFARPPAGHRLETRLLATVTVVRHRGSARDHLDTRGCGRTGQGHCQGTGETAGPVVPQDARGSPRDDRALGLRGK